MTEPMEDTAAAASLSAAAATTEDNNNSASHAETTHNDEKTADETTTNNDNGLRRRSRSSDSQRPSNHLLLLHAAKEGHEEEASSLNAAARSATRLHRSASEYSVGGSYLRKEREREEREREEKERKLLQRGMEASAALDVDDLETWFEGLESIDMGEDNFFQNFVKLWQSKALGKLQEPLEKLKNSRGKKFIDEKKEATKQLIDKNKLAGKKFIEKRRKALVEKMTMPPFVRLVDKIGYTGGIVMMLVTEFLIFQKPELVYLLYTCLILPLVCIRFVLYHKLKFHYFLLDFCYFCNFLLLMFTYMYPGNPVLFQFIFSLCNGPLLTAIVMWKNCLVFHDLDKITSVFIHIYPPIVTYCMRWFPSNRELFAVCSNEECTVTFGVAFWWPLGLYFFWQFLYILKTEIIDRKKLAKDQEIMTSARWFAKVRPHPIYKALLAYGWDINPVLLLVAFQALYTVVTLFPMKYVYEHFWLHTLQLIAVFVVCVWFGASYYFEVFSESYTKRLQERIQRRIKEEREKELAERDGKKLQKPSRYLPHSLRSFASFLFFFAGACVILYVIIETANHLESISSKR